MRRRLRPARGRAVVPSQKLALRGATLAAADEEAASRLEAGPVSPLATILGLRSAGAIELLEDANAEGYWERSDLFDMALDLTAGRRGLAALGDFIKRWIRYLLAIDVEIEPVIELRDAPLAWYVGHALWRCDLEWRRSG
jgi:hypothetical protein